MENETFNDETTEDEGGDFLTPAVIFGIGALVGAGVMTVEGRVRDFVGRRRAIRQERKFLKTITKDQES